MTETQDSLTGQVALVTGATTDVGRAVAAGLAAREATVYAATESMSDDVPDGCEHVLLDVTQEGDVEAVVDGIYAETERLDVLVNAAEFGRPEEGRDTVVTEDVTRLDRALATNVRGPMVLAKHALPLLLQQRAPRVVNVGSALGPTVGSGAPGYQVSKAGLEAFTAYLDAEYGSRGLLANTAYGPEGDEEGVAETALWLARLAGGGPMGEAFVGPDERV
ncbi:SDR family NAD(P)-dependent oxidoreductase [Halarchaeum sp. CBA1220]|uniref:SDR family NAD(P)-dependent oxidoreductase n=1 Tax=Halarchaeum sp. CBA1220 TaxID=1853682 RepID=UPI000F3A7FC6|nr:SDR family NAD(P)-dependent oxidoreductase [Halarchaeum sp. CBA1220]QLC32969.1 SDR family NAD(P)-dependent oxidoreductase [Halarchaeum sp. CBA1220]